MNLPSRIVVAYLLTSFVSMSFALNCTIFYEYTYGTSSSVVRSGSQACSQDGVEYACINFFYGGLILPDQSTTEWIPGGIHPDQMLVPRKLAKADVFFKAPLQKELASRKKHVRRFVNLMMK